MSRRCLAIVLLGSVLSLGAGTMALHGSQTAQDAPHAIPRQPVAPDTTTIPALPEPPTTTTTVDPAWRSLVDLAVRIGRCEEPGNGEYGIDWTADGYTSSGHFAGGLGIRTDLYASLSGGHYAPDDPPEEQIRVFGIAWSQFGQRAWGCSAG